MTCSARRLFSIPLVLAGLLFGLTGSAAAQNPLFEVEGGGAAKLLQVNEDAGFLVRGALNAGTIPATGSGSRLMWYPGKSAIRAGNIDGNQWDDQFIGRGSTAWGQNTQASGDYSNAWGYGSAATAELATALGNRVQASGAIATALGNQTIASGSYSTAMGISTIASGEGSTAFGLATRASGAYSTAMGYQATAGGSFSFALGASVAATGGSATAFGGSTTASADFATAMGNNSTASGNTSTAMGLRTIASGDLSIAMGSETRASGVAATAMGAASTAAGQASVAMGTRAVAQGNGSFAFADRSSTETYTALDNQFVVRAHGGIGFNSGTNIGCDLPAGSAAWSCTSSRLAKEAFEEVDGEEILTKLAGMPIERWRYIGNGALHVGPFAEDFHAAFGLGDSSTKISTVDAEGIALRAIQALERRTEALQQENADLIRRLEALESPSREQPQPRIIP